MRDLQGSRSIDNLVGAVNELSGASVCHSVLVETGESRECHVMVRREIVTLFGDFYQFTFY